MAWSSYQEAKAESGTLEPLVIGKSQFTFPNTPPAEFGVKLMEAIAETQGQIDADRAMTLLLELMAPEDLKRLRKVTTFPELMGIFDDLLREYGFETQMEGELPNPAAPTSADSSSKDSELSNQAGELTTAAIS